MLLSDFITEWRQLIPRNFFKPSTLANYESHIKCHILPYFGQREISTITVLDIQKYVVSQQERGLSAKTIRNTVMCLRCLWKSAIAWGHVTANPFFGLMLPRVDPRPKITFTLPQISAIIAASPCPFNLFIWIAAETGLRAGELCALREEDIDVDKHLVFVRQSLWSGRVQLPKSRNSLRSCVISHQLVEALRVYLSSRHSALPPGRDRVSFLFTTVRGYPWNPSAVVAHQLHPVLKQLGLPLAGLHAFRHSAATLADLAGLPLKTRQLRLGHADARVTLDVYTHAQPATEAEHMFANSLGTVISAGPVIH